MAEKEKKDHHEKKPKQQQQQGGGKKEKKPKGGAAEAHADAGADEPQQPAPAKPLAGRHVFAAVRPCPDFAHPSLSAASPISIPGRAAPR